MSDLTHRDIAELILQRLNENPGWYGDTPNSETLARAQVHATLALDEAPHRKFRCDDALWHEFQAATQQVGSNPSAVIRGLVREWVEQNKESEDER